MELHAKIFARILQDPQGFNEDLCKILEGSKDLKISPGQNVLSGSVNLHGKNEVLSGSPNLTDKTRVAQITNKKHGG